MEHDRLSNSLTAKLHSLNHLAVLNATQNPFLEQAGKGTLPSSALCTWLVQDKYYQLAYVNFIGGLIAKLPLASCAFPRPDDDNLPWTTLDLLMSALTNTRQEVEFYEMTVDKYNLPIEEAPPNDTTSQYIKLFEDASAKGEPLIHGLVVLWATEQVYPIFRFDTHYTSSRCCDRLIPLKCYLDAWTYASSQAKNANHILSSADSDIGTAAALYEEFIPNWTSEAFHGFVRSLASVTDTWAEKAEAKDIGLAKDFWLRVLVLEARFWPNV
jgi:thiaminase